MNASRTKTAISAAFGAAAARYDSAADLQQRVAGNLAARIVALPLTPRPAILEIGCGTGFFTKVLAAESPAARWTITDISEAMVQHCKARAPATGAVYAVMDGEAPCFAGPFDLICSNLALQWIDDLPRALAQLGGLLAPGGYLAFSTLGAGSFQEWHAAVTRADERVARLSYPPRDDLRKDLPQNLHGAIDEEMIVRPYGSGTDFLRQLRAIGAHRARPEQTPMTAGRLRRILRTCDGDFAVTYHVLYGLLRRT